MSKSKSISRQPPPYRSMDYEGLFQEGIRRIQQHSGAVWTDFNIHDPGITILEYLCFGITDIAYRCNFPIADLIYTKETTAGNKTDIFFTPEEILPSAAVTADDYRRLIADQVPEVDNIWLDPLTNQQEGFKGLYRIRVQLNDEIRSDPSLADPVTRILRVFAANRNLCEDVEDIQILERRFLTVEATIHLENDGSAEQVLADMLHALQHFLQPGIRYYRPEDLIASGMSVNQVYDGPLLQNGVIKEEELRPKPGVIYRSQLRDLIAGLNGVRATEHVVVSLNGITQFREEIPVPDTAYLALHPSMTKREDFQRYRPVRFKRNGREVEPNWAIAEQILNNSIALESGSGKAPPHPPASGRTSRFSREAIATYYSVQRLFPAVYGINSYGLPGNADFLRQAQALQLKGYLAICETFLASYLRQLSHLGDVFAVDAEPLKTQPPGQESDLPEEPQDLDPAYFTAFPHDIPDFDQLLDLNQREVPEGTLIMLDQTFNLRHMALQRKNEFLDHLLARFGESIAPEVLNLTAAERFDLQERYLDYIRAKARLLREYPALSRDRTRAYNYLEPTGEGTNISMLQRKLCYLLNLEPATDHRLAIQPEFSALMLSTSEADSGNQKSGVPLRELLASLGKPELFQIERIPDSDPEVWTIQFPVSSQPGASHVLYRGGTETEARTALDQLMLELRAYNRACKGMHIVEHILLRPIRKPGYSLVVSIPSGPGSFILKSLRYRSRSSQEHIAENLLVTAADPNHYVLAGNEQEKYIVLLEDGQPILISEKAYSDAEAMVQAIVRKVRQTLEEDPGALKDWVEMEKEAVEKTSLNFYSHRLSIVLPNWPAEFHTADFQMLFEHLVAQHIPPHLRVDFHWLSWKEMAAFEDTYFGWLESRQHLSTNPSRHDALALDLAALLREDAAGIEDAAGRSGKPLPDPSRWGMLFEQFGYAPFFDPSDLQIFTEIDQGLEHALRQSGYGSWSRLAGANNDTREQEALTEALKTRGFSEKIGGNISSWIVQATLALEGNWEGLIKYQKSAYPYQTPRLIRLMHARYPGVLPDASAV